MHSRLIAGDAAAAIIPRGLPALFIGSLVAPDMVTRRGTKRVKSLSASRTSDLSAVGG